jgi:hypothetical protein
MKEILFGKVLPTNKAIAQIGVKFGGCGTNRIITAMVIIEKIKTYLYMVVS